MCKEVGGRMMYPACGEARSNSENVEQGWGLVWRVGEKAGEGGRKGKSRGALNALLRNGSFVPSKGLNQGSHRIRSAF